MFYKKEDRHLLICDNCRHITWEDIPSEDFLTKYYEELYTSCHNQEEIQKSLLDYYRTHVIELADLVGEGVSELTIADVGCSYPTFLIEAAASGCLAAVGVDWSQEAQDYGLRHGIVVLQPDQFDSLVPDASLDVLRYSHTLEHLPDPLSVLRKQLKKLRPHGLVYITQPNFPVMRYGESSCDIMDSTWPTHLHFFNPLSAMRLLQEVGLTLVRFHSVTEPDLMLSRYEDNMDLEFAREHLSYTADKGEPGRGNLNNFPYFCGQNSAIYAVSESAKQLDFADEEKSDIASRLVRAELQMQRWKLAATVRGHLIGQLSKA